MCMCGKRHFSSHHSRLSVALLRRALCLPQGSEAQRRTVGHVTRGPGNFFILSRTRGDALCPQIAHATLDGAPTMRPKRDCGTVARFVIDSFSLVHYPVTWPIIGSYVYRISRTIMHGLDAEWVTPWPNFHQFCYTCSYGTHHNTSISRRWFIVTIKNASVELERCSIMTEKRAPYNSRSKSWH